MQVPLFREKLEKVRQQTGWGDKEIGAWMGVDPVTVYRYRKGYKGEKGEKIWPEPKFEEFIKLAIAWGQPLEWWTRKDPRANLSLVVKKEMVLDTETYESMLKKAAAIKESCSIACVELLESLRGVKESPADKKRQPLKTP